MKALALVLAFAVPSLAFAQAADAPLQPVLVPSATRPELTKAPARPLLKTWYFWTAVGASVVAVVAASVVVATTLSRPAPLTAQTACGPQGCDACIGLRC